MGTDIHLIVQVNISQSVTPSWVTLIPDAEALEELGFDPEYADAAELADVFYDWRHPEFFALLIEPFGRGVPDDLEHTTREQSFPGTSLMSQRDVYHVFRRADPTTEQSRDYLTWLGYHDHGWATARELEEAANQPSVSSDVREQVHGLVSVAQPCAQRTFGPTPRTRLRFVFGFDS